jgi:hypothetical protein
MRSALRLLLAMVCALALQQRLVEVVNSELVLTLKGCTADEVTINGLTRLCTGATRANVRFDDHDTSESAAGRCKVVGVSSLARLLERADTPHERLPVTLDGAVQPATRH